MNDDSKIDIDQAFMEVFSSNLGEPQWRYRLFKAILMKEIADGNLKQFFHSVKNGLDPKSFVLTEEAVREVLNDKLHYRDPDTDPIKDFDVEHVLETRECLGDCLKSLYQMFTGNKIQ